MELRSAQGWESQYDRLLRWRERIRKINASEPHNEHIDLVLAFFQNCYHLRDWLENSGVVTSSDLQALFDSDTSLYLCRSICNGSKHFRIDNRPVFTGTFAFGYLASDDSSGKGHKIRVDDFRGWTERSSSIWTY